MENARKTLFMYLKHLERSVGENFSESSKNTQPSNLLFIRIKTDFFMVGQKVFRNESFQFFRNGRRKLEIGQGYWKVLDEMY